MQIHCEQVSVNVLSELRALYRQEAGCQIVRYSSLDRGFSDAYLISMSGEVAGYGSVRKMHDPGTLTEFYALPVFRTHQLEMFASLLETSRATHIETQSNLPWMLPLLEAFSTGVESVARLFEVGYESDLHPSKAIFRERYPQDEVFPHHSEPIGPFVVEQQCTVVATGGYLTHYNPPFADLFMEVKSEFRRMGFGSFLLQELQMICRRKGLTPVARCDWDNVASRRCLERSGFQQCGDLLFGQVKRA